MRGQCLEADRDAPHEPDKDRHRFSRRPIRSWILPALATFVFWGLWGFLPKITTRYLSPRSAVLYEVIGGLLFGIVAIGIFRFRPDYHPVGTALGLITGTIGFLGAFAFLQAVSAGRVSLVVSFTALYPALSILLAVIFLGESISLRQGVGVILALIAMLLIVL